MKKRKIPFEYIFGGVLLAIFVCTLFFYQIDFFPIRLWDESRLATNAYEMSKNHDLVVTHFDGAPDMWNTKPPLMVWLQAFCIKMIGLNEYSVRLPSAIAALFTVAALLLFSIKYLKDFWFGFIAVMVLITNTVYIETHVTKTGDYESLLVFFVTLYCLFIFLYFETGKQKYLYLFFLSLAASVLTKGVAGLLFIPGLLIYAIGQKKILFLLKNPHVYIGFVVFLTLAFGYYLLRDHQNPGYITAVFKNEWGGRYFEVDGKNTGPLWFYFRKITSWVLIVPCSLIVVLFNKKSVKENKLTWFLLILIVTFFIVISISKTKLPWYAAPMYPLIALVVAVAVNFVFKFLKKHTSESLPFPFSTMLPFIFLLMVFLSPYQKVFHKTLMPRENSEDIHTYEMSYVLQDAFKGNQDINGFKVLYSGYCPHVLFYIHALNEKGVDVALYQCNELAQGDKVLVQQQNIKNYISTHYEYKILSKGYNDNVDKYLIIIKK